MSAFGNQQPQVVVAQAVLVPDDGSGKVASAPPQFQQQTQNQPQSLVPATPLVTAGQMEHLYQEHGFTPGLCNAIVRTLSEMPLRIWVVDNSGSMSAADGNRMVTTSTGATKMVACTRWNEIQECVQYHGSLARDTQAPTAFRMLNPTSLSGKAMGMGVFGNTDFPGAYQNLFLTMQRTSPGGVTPLSRHLREIRSDVVAMQGELERKGKKVCIVLATDGLPSDEQGYSNDRATNEFVQHLRSFNGLPVWVVIRLCTDEEDICDFYNNLDEQVELNLEIIDDFQGEAAEVYEHNPWLNYGLPLHRMREWGYSEKILDLLDERKLTVGEVRQFCAFLMGVEVWDTPDPMVDIKEFLGWVSEQQKSLRPTYCVVKKQTLPWFDMKKLAKIYGDGAECSLM